MGTHRLLSPLTLLLTCTVFFARCDEEQRDARQGDDLTLQCRFRPEAADGESPTYVWMRASASGHENVAIGNIPLENNYQISYAPSEGRFDLTVSNVSYERDNGRFECRIKAGGSGRTLHSQSYSLVVLTQPQPPVITPGSHAQAQEGRQLNLTCSSTGGSPNPSIKWYRSGSQYPLDAVVEYGRTRAQPSLATLVLQPGRDDDGAEFRCSVTNRAMPDNQQLDATVELSVNYFPRIEIGPENPLRVEIDGTATMECKVDAKPKVNSVKWTRNGKYISDSFVYTIQGVTVQDSGKYMCSADNGLGHPGEKEIQLDVMFPPTVTIDSKTYEAEEGGTVEINCDVSANPKPISIEWTMEGRNDFRQKGMKLYISKVEADMAGTYVCRAVNVIALSNGNRAERASSASVAVLVRHKPGRAQIAPDHPVAQEGAVVTMTCSANPPGWPVPQYRWFRDTGDTKPTVLATGSKYTIPSAHLGSEGVYHCQATNELGHGELATVNLEVYQPPRFQSKLQPHMIKNSGERNYSLTCVALGKPLPSVKWFKDNSEIRPDANLYEVKTEINESGNAVFNIESVLRFHGKARPNGDDLLPEDRGVYSCAFENEVKKVESTMQLRIEHEPIAIKQQKKVAYDLMENAEISCRVQAYPKPEFQWFYSSNTSPLQMSSEGHYEITTTTDNNDVYLSVLLIRNIKAQDYGDYYCKVKNALGNIRPQIRLQPKGAPEAPKSLTSHKVGQSYVTLKWESGFDGGLANTKYFVLYRRVESPEAGDNCAPDKGAHDWREYDCRRANPCNVTRLDQHNSYQFKVKAVNTKGQSNYSNEIMVTTKVDNIPPPEQVTFDPSEKTLSFSVAASCLPLVGVAKGLGPMNNWQVVHTMPLKLDGKNAKVQESKLEQLGRSAGAEPGPRLRLQLCLQDNQQVCSEDVEAALGPSYTKQASSVTTLTWIVISVSSIVIVAVLALGYMYCGRRSDKKQRSSKDYEMDSIRPPIVPQNQAPPPYYPCSGMENKALDSMELQHSLDDKSAVYAQGGYSYHLPTLAQPRPPQNLSNNDWVNGYMENGYAASNNGGSVNSQDSLWQMKVAAANNPPHQMMDRQNNYGYDPIAHGGYGTLDEYAPYPLAPEYARAAQTPSRQDYCSDPYASVHKPKKRMDQHIESPYHEVSGLPEPYASAGGAEEAGPEAAPHLSLSYDESLESGYSTPNSRARRVIREIIV